MKLNHAGEALIKRYEGLRTQAYRDAVGIWTIGFGHTAMAGAPEVTPGMRITRGEADAIFARDAASFADQVAVSIRAPLTDNQFSALVSFAYNVGMGAFRKSSVLKAINGNQFEAVPRRLNMWVLAGGKVLPGLVKRRAAEAALFMSLDRGLSLFAKTMPVPTDHELEQIQELRSSIQPMLGKGASSSSTVWASLVQFLATIAAFFTGLMEQVKQSMWDAQGYWMLVPDEKWPVFLLFFIGISAAWWIIKERRRKSEEDGV